MIFDGLEFDPLKEEDIAELTPIMRRAFDDDSRLFFQRPVGGPPGYDDGSFLRRWGIEAQSRAYCIRLNAQPIGAIILFLDEEQGRGVLGCLFIDSQLIGKGHGHTAWRFAEHAYPNITVWETTTPAVSYRNHRFYINKCGFQVYAVDGGKDRYGAQFKLRKQMAERAGSRRV